MSESLTFLFGSNYTNLDILEIWALGLKSGTFVKGA
jgi:hypothetical protein